MINIFRPVKTGGDERSSSSRQEKPDSDSWRIPDSSEFGCEGKRYGWLIDLLVRSDTEAQKAEKRRRLHKLKREQKQAAEEVDARNRQVSWQSHTKKTMARSTHKVGTALLHSDGTKASNKSD